MNPFKIQKVKAVLLVLWTTSIIMLSAVIPTTSYSPLQTSDTTWESLESDYPDAVFTDVSFINSTYGWVVGRAAEEPGSNAILLHTKDGGDTWDTQFDDADQWIRMIDVLDVNNIWINGMGSLFSSNDSGVTWEEHVVFERNWGMSTVKFINMTHGWTATGNVLYHTTNGGYDWEVVEGFAFNDTARMIQCFPSGNIWAIGFRGIYHSMDGGVTWARTSDSGGWALSFVSATEGWAVDDYRLAHTTNGGTWTELEVPMRAPAFRLQAPYLSDIQFIDEDNGWIAGTEIPVMYTPDGGNNWYQQTVPEDVNSRIRAVDFISETQGWAVGWNGVMLRTTSGNDIGNRLWYGLLDPLFLSIVAVVVVVPSGIFLARKYQRSKRPTIDDESYPPKIEW